MPSLAPSLLIPSVMISSSVCVVKICISGWVFTHVRSADDNYLSGVGSFLAMVGGCVLVATAAGVLKEFRRSKVYAEVGRTDEMTSAVGAAAEPAGTG